MKHINNLFFGQEELELGMLGFYAPMVLVAVIMTLGFTL